MSGHKAKVVGVLFLATVLPAILLCCKGNEPRTTVEEDTVVPDETLLPEEIFFPDDEPANDEDGDLLESEEDSPDQVPDPEGIPDVDKTPDADKADTDDTDTVSDIGTMIDIPAGPFMMGCNEEVDALCGGNEKPYHEVTLSAYRIGKYEVTTKEYRKCISAGFCSNNGAYVHYYTTSPYCNLSKSSKEDHPVQCVTWYGAKAYCAWKGGRLPTEAEWEKAARGTDGRKYPWGNEPEASCEYAVINDGGWGCGGGGTMPVGSKPLGVSPYGVHDMIGNVRELVNDYYDEGYYAVSPEVDPQGPESGTLRVGRGGCWWDIDQYLLRTSFRGGEGPDPFYLDIWGFRCVE